MQTISKGDLDAMVIEAVKVAAQPSNSSTRKQIFSGPILPHTFLYNDLRLKPEDASSFLSDLGYRLSLMNAFSGDEKLDGLFTVGHLQDRMAQYLNENEIVSVTDITKPDEYHISGPGLVYFISDREPMQINQEGYIAQIEDEARIIAINEDGAFREQVILTHGNDIDRRSNIRQWGKGNTIDDAFNLLTGRLNQLGAKYEVNREEQPIDLMRKYDHPATQRKRA